MIIECTKLEMLPSGHTNICITTTTGFRLSLVKQHYTSRVPYPIRDTPDARDGQVEWFKKRVAAGWRK